MLFTIRVRKVVALNTLRKIQKFHFRRKVQSVVVLLEDPREREKKKKSQKKKRS